MHNLNLEPWERISDECRELIPRIEAMKHPEMPDYPEEGKFYRLSPKGCLAGNCGQFHSSLKLGKESDKVLIYFGGGGVSWNEYTAARPDNLFTAHLPERFYFNEVEWMGDFTIDMGINSLREENNFRDWTVLVIPYSTGDFHCGNGDFPYTALDGSQRVLPHHGYRNTMSLLRMAKPWLKTPDTLVIAGVSAGGFGVSLMADDVISEFPGCENITCVVDSSLVLANDWKYIAKEVWKSPEHICARLNGNNITLDSYTALYHKRGNMVKYLFASSTRDALLVSAQNALEGRGHLFDKAGGELYQRNLNEMCNQLIERIPTIGLYIFQFPWGTPGYEESELTEHCALYNSLMYDHQEEGKSLNCWLWDAIDGQVSRIGLSHLQ